MNIVLEEGAIMPSKAHDTDAGFDLCSRSDQVIFPNGSALFDTGVHIELPKYTVGFLKSKSGLNVKYGITSDGVIDEGYTGSIVVKLYNHSDKIYKVNKGDKITQLVILPLHVTYNFELIQVGSLDETSRGNNGFGSTGK